MRCRTDAAARHPPPPRRRRRRSRVEAWRPCAPAPASSACSGACLDDAMGSPKMGGTSSGRIVPPTERTLGDICRVDTSAPSSAPLRLGFGAQQDVVPPPAEREARWPTAPTAWRPAKACALHAARPLVSASAAVRFACSADVCAHALSATSSPQLHVRDFRDIDVQAQFARLPPKRRSFRSIGLRRRRAAAALRSTSCTLYAAFALSPQQPGSTQAPE